MVSRYECSFCGHTIEPGTGMVFVRTNKSVLRFCSRKCRVSMLVFKRDPRKFKWTKKYVPKIKS